MLKIITLDKGEQSRRNFFKTLIGFALAGSALLIGKMVKTNNSIYERKSVTLSLESGNGVSFADDFIIVRKDGNINVFSSKCTHLGCKINETSENALLCPCHGSKFNLDGVPVSGPALKPLETLDFELNKSKTSITIKL